MDYQSTRDRSIRAVASAAVLKGIAPDGGLYMLRSLPRLDLSAVCRMSAPQISVAVLSALLDDYSEEECGDIVQSAYAGRFETDDLVPLSTVGDVFVLELYHGPTAAFKDVALCALPHLLTRAKKKQRVTDTIMILTATSGDTGKAALSGFSDVPGTRVTVFYPHGGVSAVQRAQMVTQRGENVSVCGVRGNFDDAQSGVKRIFGRADRDSAVLPDGVRLSSANSINIGRLAPQVMYYFKAYADLVRRGVTRLGERVDFAVPTGNFGDILAGYIANLMGLPIGTLICASNRNDVLADFLASGVYDRRRPFYRTLSPSMDILVSSNLERLLFLLSGGDESETAGYMRLLAEEGRYAVSDRIKAALHRSFRAASVNDEETRSVIGRVWRDYGYLIDPHTAVAFCAAERMRTHRPLVVLSTASAYKFSRPVLQAIRGAETAEDEFAAMDALASETGVPIPKNLSDLRDALVLHPDVIDQEGMLSYVQQKAGRP